MTSISGLWWGFLSLTDHAFFYRVPWPQACHSSVLWCLMAQDWHPNLSRTPTVCLYWRNSRGSNSNSRHSRQTQVQHTELMWSRQEPICIQGNVEPFLKNKNQLLLFRTPWNIRADPSAIPFPNSNGHNNHGTARKHTSLQHPSDAHDPHHTSHTGLRELWNCTSTTVCWKLCQS